MNETSPALALLVTALFILCGIARLVEAELRDPVLAELIRRYLSLRPLKKLLIGAFVVEFCLLGGSKPTNWQQQASSPLPVAEAEMTLTESVDAIPVAGGGSLLMSLTEGGEPLRLTSNQYAAGFALLPRAYTNTAWLTLPSNAVVHAPWAFYGVAEDTFWLPATNWSFVLGTNAAEGAHVSSSGTLSFDTGTPKGSPRAAATPDGDTISFLAPLQGGLGTVPPQGRFWHAVTASNSVLMTWQDLYAGRDTNSPVTFQTELFASGDFAYRYSFTNTVALTNFVIGAQHNGGGETYALDATNKLINGLEVRWRAFGMLDPGVDDHDDDGLSTYDEVMTYGTDPTMPDTDLDGLTDFEELSAGTSPLARDFDGDGIPDGGDPNPLSSDTADLDGDGLPDAWEVHWFGGTNVTDSAGADTNGDGFSDRSNLLAGANPAFAVCAVTTSRGPHLFAWTRAPAATNYSAAVSCGGTGVWTCVTNVCTLSVTGDFTSAEHTLTVTAACTNGPALEASSGLRQPSRPNLTVWRIADPFATESPSNNAAVLERTFRIGRVRQWQQYYVSAGHDSAAPWSLDGLRLEWRDSTGAAGTNSASPAGDSLALAVGPDADTLTVRLVTTRGGGLARSPRTLNLLGWSPAVAFGTNATLVAADGERALVVVTGQDGLPLNVSFGVDAAGRPCNAPLSDSERAALLQPLGPAVPDVLVETDANGLPVSGRLTSAMCGMYAVSMPGGGPLEAENPSGGGGGSQPRPDVWPGTGPEFAYYISPVVSHVQGDDTARRWTCGDDDYPFDRECLREGFENGGCVFDGDPVEDPQPAGFEVSLGQLVPGGVFTIEIGENTYQEPPAFYAWDGDEQQKGATVKYGETVVWGESVQRQPVSRESPCWGAVWDGECGGCGGSAGTCAGGDCSAYEGDGFGSIRFRVPLGQTGYETSAGFLWFDMDTVQAVTPASFRIAHDPATVIRRDAAGAVTNAVRSGAGGRDVRIDTVADGVRVSVRDTGDATEDRSWTITNATGSLTFVKKDGAGNVLRNVSYSVPSGTWRRIDNDTGVLETLLRFGNVTNGEECVETITSDQRTAALSGHAIFRTLIGSDTAAVVREIRRSELERDGAMRLWRTTYMTYWEDSLNSLVNGSPKFRYSDGGDWDYRAFDSQGRETLRVEVLDGSGHPPFVNDPTPFAFSSSSSYPALTGLVTVTSYAPVLDDGDSLEDSLEPRQVSRYAVRGGAPALISREWHVYTRGTTGDWPSVTRRDIRAASQAAAAGGVGNAESVFVSVVDDASVPPLMRGRPLCETQADGTVLSWEYAIAAGMLTVTSRRGAVANVSTYEVETLDATFGRTLSRETRLYTGGGTGPLLSSETRGYDAEGRLLATSYSDGTCESNVWGCCQLDAKIARNGTRTDYSSVPGDNHKSVTEQTSFGGLPGANGCPAVESYTDGAGRETGSVTRVYSGGNPVAGYAPQVTATSYPDGTRFRSVTGDPFGVATARCNYLGANYEADETVSGGVTHRETRVSGGATMEENQWIDPVSGAAKSLRTRTETAWDGEGREIETVSSSRDGGPWTAASATVRDLLGREVSVSAAGFGGAMLVASNTYDNTGRRIQTLSHDGSREFYTYDALGNRAGVIRVAAGQALQFDPETFTLQSVIELDAYSVEETTAWKEEGDLGLSAHGVPTAWWDCAATVSHLPGQGGVTTSVRRVQLTGLSTACVARTVTTDVEGVSEIESEALDAAGASKTVTRLNAATGAFETSTFVAGIEVARTNSLGSSASYSFDGFARRTSEEGRAGARVLRAVTGYRDDGSTAFDSQISGATTNVTAYSARQYLESPAGVYSVTATDALDNQTVRYYHPSGGGDAYRVEGAAYPTDTARDADGRQSELRTWRDESGQPDVTRWRYDAATGLLTNKVYADGKGPAYTYTADGRPASRTWARGVTATYAYANNADGGVQIVGYSDSTPCVTNRYDLAGRLTGVQDGAGSRTLSYDAKGRLTAETNSLAVITRTYDALGLPSFFAVDSEDGTAYAYDNLMRLTNVSVGGLSFGYTYLPQSRLIASMTNSSGIGWRRIYEANRDLVAAVTNFCGTTAVTGFSYANDALGRRVARNGDAFAYNARSELTNAVIGVDAYGYVYDCIGNLLLSAANTVSNTYTANALNQYDVITNSAFSTSSRETIPVYDCDGNMLTNGVWAYAWDAENRMTGALSNGSVRVTNAYDYQGRRILKSAGSVTNDFVYDGWNLYREIETAGRVTVTNIYVWGLDLSGTLQGAGGVGGLLAVLRNGVPYFPCYDANGNVTDYLDANGTVVAHREYGPFGMTTVAAGPLVHDLHFWFSTKYLDEETRLYYYGYRYYLPELGRWLNRDNIGEDGGLNLYAITGNDPANKTDYLGMASVPWDEIARIQHFDMLKKQLKSQLRSMCPESATRWKKDGVSNRCCRPDICKEEAERLSDKYINKLEEAYRWRRGPGGYWGNYGPGPFRGKTAEEFRDTDLTCAGWADLALKALDHPASTSQCWSFKIEQFNLFWLTWHEWGSLQIMDGAKVNLDPYPSGGKWY